MGVGFKLQKEAIGVDAQIPSAKSFPNNGGMKSKANTILFDELLIREIVI